MGIFSSVPLIHTLPSTTTPLTICVSVPKTDSKAGEEKKPSAPRTTGTSALLLQNHIHFIRTFIYIYYIFAATISPAPPTVLLIAASTASSPLPSCNPFPQFFLSLSLCLSSHLQLCSSRLQISLHFGNMRSVSRSVTLQHALSEHDNAVQGEREASLVWRVK